MPNVNAQSKHSLNVSALREVKMMRFLGSHVTFLKKVGEGGNNFVYFFFFIIIIDMFFLEENGQMSISQKKKKNPTFCPVSQTN